MVNMCGFVSNNFSVGVVIPIMKFKCSKITSADNYRSITINPVFKNIFEYCILHKSRDQLRPSDLQFSFKKHLRCAHAIFAVRAHSNMTYSKSGGIN